MFFNTIQDIQDYLYEKNCNYCDKYISNNFSISKNNLNQIQTFEFLLEKFSKQGNIIVLNKILRLVRKLNLNTIDQSYFLIKAHLNLLLSVSSEEAFQELLPKYFSETTFFYNSFKSSLPRTPTISHWELILQFYIKANTINYNSFPFSLLIDSLLQIQASGLKLSLETYFMIINALVVSPEFRPPKSDYAEEIHYMNTTIRIKKVLYILQLLNNQIELNINKGKLFEALYLACCPSIIQILQYTLNQALSLNQDFRNINLILDSRAFLIEDLMILHKIPCSFEFEKLKFIILASCNLWDIFWIRLKNLSISKSQRDKNLYTSINELIASSKEIKAKDF
ncbi:uncharacterized protein T551_00404 [Pneumocystis jirovecii RU7]|uniref:Uncharacterized protein n=1 Tax=Pneumocystis jirovecii (strain RU7) TaxID=1408657 RepID=A0A0W4ZVB4_PNEJ7|nr:uncharacterized protein T551_00404 [Pneumocystis jirovecii RU7]KTW32313.1 hypothetical protein T551_00404 [Pneumocystis jirovecii RU7]